MQKVKKVVHIQTKGLSADECKEIFVTTFSTKASFGINASWEVSRSRDQVAARFAGGRNQILASFSEIAEASQSRARGSLVLFRAEDRSGGGAQCRLWLDEYSTKMGVVDCAPTLIGYIDAAARAIAKADGGAAVHRTND